MLAICGVCHSPITLHERKDKWRKKCSKCGEEIEIDETLAYSTGRCKCGQVYYAEGRGDWSFNNRPRFRDKGKVGLDANATTTG